jgi:hypothetical protein
MLKMWFGDNLEARWWKADEKYHLADFFNRRMFRVSSSSLTYRQINNLEASGLFKSERSEDSKWRLLSFKEILYMELVAELRKFGFKNNQLVDLRDMFFGPPDMDSSKYRSWCFLTTDLIIGTCFGSGTEVILSIGPDGEGSFSEPIYYLLFERHKKSRVIIKVNEFVNKILIKTGRKPFPIRVGLDSTLLETELTKKEKDLIDKMRKNKADSVTVKMKDGQPETAYFSSERVGEMNMDDIAKQLEESNFQEVRIIKRDGKIVNMKNQKSVKLGAVLAEKSRI